MLFNSFIFLAFFVVVTIGYFLLPHKRRWILLLIASYIFYMAWRPELIILIVFTTFTNYACALAIHRETSNSLRKRYLMLSLFLNFGLLFIFKYLVFMNESFMMVWQFFGGIWYGIRGLTEAQAQQIIANHIANYPFREMSIILPMGISFYTFQASSYTIDVYLGRIKPVRHYGIFSLFITFFPQLVAGPIERSENLLPQFYTKHQFRFDRMILGLKIMLLGYFKKIVIADRIAVAVNTVYNSPQSYSGLYFTLATVLFAFQIYCDFSGYSDIAKGAAKVLGFELMENFKSPYLSKSIKEFWKRWHISLSSWFMDYVYIPLGGSREGRGRLYRNLFITFAVSGLWHGSNWTFVLWGAVHGLFQIFGAMTKDVRTRIKQFLHLENHPISNCFSILMTFGLVCFAWIFFRANTAGDAFYVITHLFKGLRGWADPQYLFEVFTGMGLNLYEFKIVFFAIVILIASELLAGKRTIYGYLEKKPYIFRLAYYVLIAGVVMTAGVYYDAGAFIYFQF